MPIEEQVKKVSDGSVYLCKRRKGDITYFLYQMNAFYVEVLYNHYLKKITHLFTFQSTLLLEPYLKEMHVKHMS
jgi:hypothetical protein